jgi:hypothetical protein
MGSLSLFPRQLFPRELCSMHEALGAAAGDDARPTRASSRKNDQYGTQVNSEGQQFPRVGAGGFLGREAVAGHRSICVVLTGSGLGNG